MIVDHLLCYRDHTCPYLQAHPFVLQDNQPPMDRTPDESPFQQVITSIPEQSLYPSLATMGTSINTALSTSIPFTRKVIKDIEEQQKNPQKYSGRHY